MIIASQVANSMRETSLDFEKSGILTVRLHARWAQLSFLERQPESSLSSVANGGDAFLLAPSPPRPIRASFPGLDPLQIQASVCTAPWGGKSRGLARSHGFWRYRTWGWFYLMCYIPGAYLSNMWSSLFLFPASTAFLADSQPPNRKALVVYPIFLFYFVISWMILTFTP